MIIQVRFLTNNNNRPSIPLEEIEDFLRVEAEEKGSRSEESDEGDIEPSLQTRSKKTNIIASSGKGFLTKEI